MTEVEQDESRKDLLADELRLFRMKSIQTDRIFQLPERRLDPPTQVIELPERSRRELALRKVRHQIFVGSIRKADADDTKSQIVKQPVMQVTKIKAAVLGKKTISLGIFFHQSFGIIRLLFCECNGHSAVKLLIFG